MKNIKYIAAAFLVSGILSAQKINTDEMPKPGSVPTINIAEPKSFQLKNGLTVLVVENNKLPRVNISLTIDRQPVYEGNIVGAGNLMADLLGNGTNKLSKEQFNKKIDFLGANIHFNSQGASANTLSKYFPQVIELFSDAITNARFTTDDFLKEKERTIESLKIEEKDANTISNRVFNALAYGKNTSRGEFSTQESINKIQLKDVQDFYYKYYTPNSAYLVIVGDVKFNDVKKLVEKQFQNWKKSTTKFQALEPAKNVTKTEINIVDLPAAVQSVIKVGNLSTLQMKDSQYFAGLLGNYILGGGAEARLFMNLREKNGFTYGAYSNLSTNKYGPSFEANASVRNEVTDKAVVEFMNEIKGIPTIKPEELANAKEKIKGTFIMSLEKPETLARFAVNQHIQKLPKNFYSNYLKSIDKVTIADVSNAMKANVLSNQSRIVVVGKANDIMNGLEKLGYSVTYYDALANPVKKPEVKKVDPTMTTKIIREKYIVAIGGKNNINKINSLTTNAEAELQGMKLDMNMVQAKGGKSIVEMKMMGQTMQKIVFDGKDGYISANGQKMPLPQELKTEMSQNQELFPELTFDSKNTELKGIETIKGEDAYVVKKGKKTYYYSTKSGLKIGETQTQKAPDGKEVTIPTYYSEYKEISGIKVPFKINQNMSGMDVEFKVKSYEVNTAKDSDFK